MQNISKEDYLGVIYKHRETDGTIKANQIAEKLSVTNAAVTDMLRKLAKGGFVNYKRYKGIKLTDNWEVFLHQIVGMPWDRVHKEAHNLEHSASDELINRMEEMLNFPAFDPHGDPIPSKEGVVPKQRRNVSLNLLKEHAKGKVVRVNDFDNKFLNYISKIGVELGKEISVKEILDFDRSMLVVVDGKETSISSTIAANIFVEVNKN
jgi:DtxR family Mn-dependent transcriptional regulator